MKNQDFSKDQLDELDNFLKVCKTCNMKKINSSFLLSNSKNPIKKLKLLKKSSSFSYNLIISRLKGQLNLSNNFTFFKNQKAFLRNNFSNFIFTNPNFKKYFYAHKKRLKNKTFKSKNKKIR